MRTGTIRFATRGVHRLAYEVVADTGVADAPVMVLLHALLGERADFAVMREVLQAESIPLRLIIPDARGHGTSAALANLAYSLEDMIAELVAILVAEGVEHAHVVGHDLGGATAFGLACAYPDRIQSLTLIEPALGSLLDQAIDPVVRSDRTAVRESDRAAADAAYKGMTDVALDRYLSPRRGPSWRQELPKPRLAALRRNAGALGGTLTALEAAPLSVDAVERITVPIQVAYRENAPEETRQITCSMEGTRSNLNLVELPPEPSPLAGEAGVAVGKALRDVVAETR